MARCISCTYGRLCVLFTLPLCLVVQDDIGGADLLINKARDSTDALREANCSWKNLAKLVSHKLNTLAKEQRKPEKTWSDACIRHYCTAAKANSLVAKRHHHSIAGVSNRKATAASDEFHIDAVPAFSHVRNFEQLFASYCVDHPPDRKFGRAFYEKTDDHAKWLSDSKRGLAQRRTLMLNTDRKRLPYSDQKAATIGVKVVTDSILILLHPCHAAEFGGHLSTTRDDAPCVKVAAGVSRIEQELRSTPCQQINDCQFLLDESPALKSCVDECTVKLMLSDGGWDHQVRNDEVQYAITRDHLASDRNVDYNFCRNANASSYSEAERVNASETTAMTKADVPSLGKLPLPRNATELKRNRRAVLRAIVNALKGATYAKRNLLSIESTTDAPSAPFISEAERLAARAIMAKPRDKRSIMPMAKLVMTTLRYRELHAYSSHYTFQLSRNACSLSSRLGRLCRASDYPFGGSAMGFQACSTRPWRGRDAPPAKCFFCVTPPLDEKKLGHFKSEAETRAMIERGGLSPEYIREPPSRHLKPYYETKSKVCDERGHRHATCPTAAYSCLCH